MYFTDRGIEELAQRRGDDEVTLAWLADQLRTFVDLNPEFETAIERLATWLARLDDVAGAPLHSDARVFTGTPAQLADLLLEWQRAGLTGFVAGMARQVAEHGVCVNNLLPGIHDTDRATSLDQGVSKAQGISPDEARRRREATIPTRNYGRAEDFGAACAFLCSQQARFIVGQNLVLDGGAMNVTV